MALNQNKKIVEDGEDRESEDSGSRKVRLSMWLTIRQHSELKEIAAYEGRTVSDLIRQLVGIFLRDNSMGKNGVRG